MGYKSTLLLRKNKGKETLFPLFNVNYKLFLIFEEMKGFSAICFVFLGFGPLFLFSQTSALDSLRKNRENAVNFRNTLEMISEPATVSGTRFFDYHTGIKKPYLFNGDFQLALTIGGPRYVSGRKHKWVHAFQFIPSTRVRLFQNDPAWQDKSKPVRTPSFFPRLYYLFSPEKFWNTSYKWNFYSGMGFAHHSNGQDGTEFVDFTDTVNLYNGSFSESLILQWLVGGNLRFAPKTIDHGAKIKRKKRLDSKPLAELSYQKTQTLNWKLIYEDHPAYFANQKFYQTGVYGGNRVILNLSYIQSRLFDSWYRDPRSGGWKSLNDKWSKENFRITLNLEYITDLSFYSGGYNHLERISLGNFPKRFNGVLTAYKRILDSRYPALFAQLAYFGSDNYNIYFQKSFYQLRLGLAFAFFDYRKL